MENIYPKEELQEKFESKVSFNFYFMDDIDTIASLEPNCLHEIGGNAWMHYIKSGANVNPQKLNEHFNNRDPFLFREVEKITKTKVIQDVMLVHANVQDPKVETQICGQLLLARTYPNNLHISEVAFSNPYKPVPDAEKKHPFHEFRSLGLFSTLLRNILAYCKKYRISKITLSAASKYQIGYFESHGFSMENNHFSKIALEQGVSIPMELKCIEQSHKYDH